VHIKSLCVLESVNENKKYSAFIFSTDFLKLKLENQNVDNSLCRNLETLLSNIAIIDAKKFFCD
jgi:hypothetical protein